MYHQFLFEGYGIGAYVDGKHKHPALALIKENGKKHEIVAIFTSERHAARFDHFMTVFFSEIMTAQDYYKEKAGLKSSKKEPKKEESGLPKRGRGRPKGSKDRPKVSASTYNAMHDPSADEEISHVGYTPEQMGYDK